MGTAFTGLLYAALLFAAEEGAPAFLTANEHPWGNFPAKSWCIVQTQTISNIEGRNVRSSQTVKTVLEAVDENSITLSETETVEFAGKSVEKAPTTTIYDFFRERIQENVQIRQGEPAKLQMNDKRVVPCSVRIYTQQTPGGHLTTTIWYTSQAYPYIFRVEKTLRSATAGSDNAGGEIIRQSVMLVQETSALKRLRGNRRNRTYTTQTIDKTGNITKITDARCSWDVPGGLLVSTTREFDAQNREIRRSESRMTNMYIP